MTIELTNQVDIVSYNQNQGIVYLDISDHLPWQHHNKLLLIQNKVNRYLKYIESGEMYSQHSQSVQLNPFIRLICMYQPQIKESEFLCELTAIIEQAGYNFSWHYFDPEQNLLSDS